MSGGAATDDAVLAALRSRERESLDRIVPVVYTELRRIARRQLARGAHRARGGETLATTALVNEAYLKLVNQSKASWRDRAHFLALAAVAMRHILIDRAKWRLARKRGSGRAEISLDVNVLAADDSPQQLLEVNDAFDRLAALDPRLARVAEYRFFGGLTDEEIAEVLGVTSRTVQRDWAKARLLLRRALAD